MGDKEKVKEAIRFFRKMAEKSGANVKRDMSYRDGVASGGKVAWSVAADYLEDVFELKEEEQ